MKIIIVGCGRTGALLANSLIEQKNQVVVIDQDPTSFVRLAPGFRGRTIEGIGFDQDVLMRAGLGEADAVAAVTNDEKVNLMVATIAKQYAHVPRVVARLFEPELLPLYESLGVPAVSSVSWRVYRIEQLLCQTALNITGTLGNGEVVQITLNVTAALEGRTLAELTAPGRWQPQVIIHAGAAQLSLPESTLKAGDSVHLLVAAEALDDLRTWLASQGEEVNSCAR